MMCCRAVSVQTLTRCTETSQKAVVDLMWVLLLRTNEERLKQSNMNQTLKSKCLLMEGKKHFILVAFVEK